MPRLIVLVAVASVALAGCEKSDPPAKRAPPAPAPAASVPAEAEPLSPAQFEDLMASVIVLFKDMGAASETSDGDCGKLAASLERVMTDNQALIARVKRFKNEPPLDKQAEEWMKAHQTEVMAPLTKFATAAQTCAADAAFQTVMTKLTDS